jgi:hypothetical protein
VARDERQEVIFEVEVDYPHRDRSIRADGENSRVEEMVVRTLTAARTSSLWWIALVSLGALAIFGLAHLNYEKVQCLG